MFFVKIDASRQAGMVSGSRNVRNIVFLLILLLWFHMPPKRNYHNLNAESYNVSALHPETEEPRSAVLIMSDNVSRNKKYKN